MAITVLATLTMSRAARPASGGWVSARRTLAERKLVSRQGATAANKPNFKLDEPERLWEIGGSYWLPFADFVAPQALDASLRAFPLPPSFGFNVALLTACFSSSVVPNRASATFHSGCPFQPVQSFRNFFVQLAIAASTPSA
jgi:hypothetical protein